MIKIHIGIDDTDSYEGGCTTYIASVLSEKLDKKSWIKFIDYPYLVRLNPNIPFKTRGNGSVALRMMVKEDKLDKLMDEVWSIVLDNSFITGKTSPALIFWQGDISDDIKRFYYRALTSLISFTYLDKIMRKNSERIVVFFKGKRRGLIGALAAIGALFTSEDYTFEIIAYRNPYLKIRDRKIDPISIIKFDRKFRPNTFNNYDYVEKRVLITPHGPDPVIFGVRGNDPHHLLIAFEKIITYEKIERWTIFKTNQCTDAHLYMFKKIRDVRPYDSVALRGKIVSNPNILRGGHILFNISDETGQISVITYRETGRLCKVVKLLKPGDIVEVYGGIKPHSNFYPKILNLEKIKVVKLSEIKVLNNPICPICGKRMMSAGRNRGFKCKRCKFTSKKLSRYVVVKPRLLKPGIYIASPKAQRHLTKPLLRYYEKGCRNKKIITPWHYP